MNKLIIPLLVLLLLIAIPERRRAEPVFRPGEIVYSTLGSHEGQIYSVRCYNTFCTYYVRFVANTEQTDVHWLGADGDIHRGPFALAEMREHELKRTENE